MGPLAITPGDPEGIGPEVVQRALQQRREAGDLPEVVVFGDAAAMRRACDLVGGPMPELVEPSGSEPVEIGAIRMAVDACIGERCSALVTGPIHKARLMRRGFQHPGHTDFLGELCGIPSPVMAFVGGRVRVALVTVHLPLSSVPKAVTSERVLHTITEAHRALREHLGMAQPRLAVCGLNPHAGDDGILGTEEREQIGPAVEAARERGIVCEGPISAETAFCEAVSGKNDMVIAMYHDQGLAPLKALDFGRTVNWTLGLPVIRTSVDHGTAYDIAWSGRASASSMLAAIGLAETLVRAR